MRITLRPAALGAACLFVAGAAHARPVYFTEASFLADVGPGSFLNNFSDVPAGPSTARPYSGGTPTMSCVVDSAPTPDDLFNGPGLISVNVADERIVVNISSGNVTAIGGNFWATDIELNPIVAAVTVMTSDGQSSSFTSSGPSDFRGFTSNSQSCR